MPDTSRQPEKSPSYATAVYSFFTSRFFPPVLTYAYSSSKDTILLSCSKTDRERLPDILKNHKGWQTKGLVEELEIDPAKTDALKDLLKNSDFPKLAKELNTFLGSSIEPAPHV